MAPGPLFLLLFHQPISGEGYQHGLEPSLMTGKDYQPRGDYQIQATGEDYQNDQWGPWSKCNQGQGMKKRCTRGGDKCEALSCNPPTFGPRGDYQVQAQVDDYQIQAQREGYQNEERHRACPKKQPGLGSPCSVPESESCSYGSECCCGKCHPSFQAKCDRKYGWRGLYTDACMRPNCGKAACPKK